jgi:Uma2 family endonuclease
MNWAEVCADPYFRDAPYKIELNPFGKVVMSPASYKHSVIQFELGMLLRQHLGGVISVECPVKIGASVKVPDVAWLSPETDKANRQSDVATVAPEICIEVLSPSNDMTEMKEKMALYLSAGTKEVWLCSEDGKVRFFGAEGERDSSTLAPEFPSEVDIT